VEEYKGYYAVIPADVRYDKDLPANAKLLYGEITALCSDKGYCWATNTYFAELYGVSVVSISKWITALNTSGYISVIDNKDDGNRRQILLNKSLIPIKENFNTLLNENLIPIKENFNTLLNKSLRPIKEKFKQNNTINITSEYKEKDKYITPSSRNIFIQKEKPLDDPEIVIEKAGMDRQTDCEYKKAGIDRQNLGKNQRTRFVPPTLDDVKGYCACRNSGIDPEKWYDHYQSNGWMVGKTKMKDWKASVRTWERNEKEGRFKDKNKDKPKRKTEADFEGLYKG